MQSITQEKLDEMEFESDSDEAGSDLDMSQLPEDREQEDSDEVCELDNIFNFKILNIIFLIFSKIKINKKLRNYASPSPPDSFNPAPRSR